MGTPAAVSDAMKNRRRTTTKTKRPSAPKVGRAHKPSIAIANADATIARLKRERDEALEQQKATAEVLRVISASPGDLKPAFAVILENATRLCEANFGVLFLCEGDAYRAVAMHNAPSAYVDARQREPLVSMTGTTVIAEVARTKRTIQTADMAKDPAYQKNPLYTQLFVRLTGARSFVAVPMLKEGELIGLIGIYRKEVRPFTDKQIAVVESFAAQAVIAIENTRLLNELREALEQQMATSEVLRVISSSPGQLEPVFDAMLENAVRICEAHSGTLVLREDDGFRVVALHGAPAAFSEARSRQPIIRFEPGHHINRLVQTKSIVHIPDLVAEPAAAPHLAKLAGARTLLSVPMLKDNEVIGAFGIYRKEVRPFTDKQIAVIESFAAQAVIAIENTRLLNELRQRTDDLTESLEQQTATSEVLSVISSSPGELEPVFQAMLENATRLCEAKFGGLLRYENETLYPAATLNYPPAMADFVRQRGLFLPTAGSALDRAFKTKEVIYVDDDAAEAVPTIASKFGGARSYIAVPMLKDDEVIGLFIIYRQEVRPFTDKQIELVQNFAAQAVIAIENTRLLNELRQSLEQQTATADVLRVISSSPGDLEPVFGAMLENAIRICEAKFGNMFLIEDGMFRTVAMHNAPAAYANARTAGGPFRPPADSGPGRLVSSQDVVHIADLKAEETYLRRDPFSVAGAELAGIRTLLAVPMLKDDALIGAIVIYRQEVRPFTDKQIDLVRNFAAQAVIAIENTRLLNELRELLQRQTATSEVLGVISSSPGELEPVFRSILENATGICQAQFGTLNLYDGEAYRTVALHNPPPQFAQRLGVTICPHPESGLAHVARTKKVAHIDDLRTRPPYLDGDKAVIDLVDLGGARTLLIVPMLKDEKLVGAISIYRQEVRPFTDKQIELVQNFAAQAVIAIENTRLLNELRELLQQQTATSEVLSVISSSPGELEPVFQAMLENATRICEAKFGTLFLREGDTFRFAAEVGTPPELAEFQRRRGPFQPLSGGYLQRVMQTKQVSHSTDAAAETVTGLAARLGGARSLIAVPMLKENALIGAIIIYRQEVRPFTDKQIALVENFAAQAVIAIENTRLLNELRQSLDQQTATAEVLSVISSSPGRLEPVFQSMLRECHTYLRGQVRHTVSS